MPNPSLLPAINEVLQSIRRKQGLDTVLYLILEKACQLARATHGSFALVDHEARQLTISNVFGSDWTPREKNCQLQLGQGLTGKVAATGQAILCRDTLTDPDYFPLFHYVRSELVVPVFVQERIWGVINIDDSTPDAFDETTLQLLVVFAELAASAITLQLEVADHDRLNRKLLQAEKLASLGEALAGIAHEINNPLTSILCYGSLLSQDNTLNDENRHALKIIVSETERAAGLIRGLLEFSRKETGRREHLDAATLIEEVVGLKQYSLQLNGVVLQLAPPPGPCPLYVCPQQIKQVLLNLITNAEQAMPKERTAPRIIRLELKRDGDLIRLIVADNGTGIPDPIRGQIFDPFFTTKAPREGTGLGLSISHTIMQAHGGAIHLASSSPEGTTFHLDLPLAHAEPAPPPIITPPPAPGAPIQRVMIVDDEPAILTSLGALLAHHHRQVRCVASGNEALALLSREKYDLILTDINMPELNGLQLHQEASRLDARYAHRFVFMSGYLMRHSTKAHLAATRLPCLQKPFSVAALEQVLGRHLPPPASFS